MAHLYKRLLEVHETYIDLDMHTVYLFTWNPKDKVKGIQHEYTNKWKGMINILKHFSRCMSKYSIVPEVSDAGRLHCHGWFIIKDKIKWHKSVHKLLTSNGLFKMNKMKGKKGLEYYKKDIELTINLVDPDYWPYTDETSDEILERIDREILELFAKYKNKRHPDDEDVRISKDITRYFKVV